MTVLEDIYKFIGENNLGITNCQIKWKIDGCPFNTTVELVNRPDYKYYIEMIAKFDITKNITMTDDKVLNYNCTEEVMKDASNFVKYHIKDLDNIFPSYINLNIGDKYICIEDRKISSDVEYNIVKRLYKLIHLDTITRKEYEIVEKKDGFYKLKIDDNSLFTTMHINIDHGSLFEGSIRLDEKMLLVEYYKNNRYICHMFGLDKNLLFLIEILDDKVVLDIVTQNSLNNYKDKDGNIKKSKNRFITYKQFLELKR